MPRFLAILTVLLLTGATLFQGRVRVSQFQIQKQAGDYVISWQTDIEQDVREFEVLRRTPNSQDEFVSVHTVGSHGVNKPYDFRDTQVFKSGSDQLDYRLDVVYENGVREVLKMQSMNYTTTAVRRTWGSLKAMFQ